MAVIPLPPKLWSDVWFGDERHVVIGINGTSIATLPEDVFEKYVRFTHQGNLQNAEGEYEWSV